MEAYIGLITMFAGNFAPRGWQLCAGQILSIAQNTALFSILGTTYGGNGQTTFALPDLRGRVPVGQGAGPGLSPYVLGQVSGTENVSILISNMPAHTHIVSATETATSNDPKGLVPGNESVDRTLIYGAPDGTTMAPNMNSVVGNNVPISILQPYLAINFIICMEGIFPSRN